MNEFRQENLQDMRDQYEAECGSHMTRVIKIYETTLHRMLAMSNADPKAYADCARDALDRVAKLKENT